MDLQYSVWSDYYNDMPIEESVLRLISHGFCRTELSINHSGQLLARAEKPEVTGSELQTFIKEHNFAIPQGHLSYKRGLCSAEAVDALKREIDLFLSIGIENAVLHVNGGNDLAPEVRLERRTDSLRELANYIKGTPLRLCLENLGSVPETHTVERIRKFIDAVGSDQVKICLDTGHLHLVNGQKFVTQSQTEFIHGAGNDLCAMHITNNSGESDVHLMPFSSRTGIDWKEVVSALREIGYTGLFNLEILGENKAPLPIRDAKLDYIKKMLDYMCTDEFLRA